MEEVELDENSDLKKAFISSMQSKLKKRSSLRDPNVKTAREEDKLAKKLAAMAKTKKEDVELDEAAPKIKPDFVKTQREKDAEHAKAMGRSVKTGRKLPMTSTQRSLASMRKEETEINEASDLRITKVYNKFPKKATYAVHTPDRKYYKEFDSMEAAKAHHAEKTGK
jgi:hypothetical protein